MATIKTGVQWGTGPKITFDFAYEKRRVDTTQYYTISVTCKKLEYSTSYFGYPIYVQISLDGALKETFTLKEANPSRWEPIVKKSSELFVANKTTGKTALTIRIYSGLGSTRDITYQYSLDIDPAPSTISATTAKIESNPTIAINRASTNFTHTITYKFRSLSGTIATKTSETRITSWKIPPSFYAEIPDERGGVCTLTCTTYLGSTQVGSPTTCTLYVTTDESKCKPTVSGTVLDINSHTKMLTGNAKVLIRYHSIASCELTATLNRDAGSITEKKINDVVITSNKIEIPKVEVGTFTFYAKDSREYYNTYTHTDNLLVPYVSLTCNAVGQRTEPTSGNATITIGGKWYNGTFGATRNALELMYKPSSSDSYITLQPTISGNDYTVTIPLTGLDYTKSFRFDIIVSDELEMVKKQVTIKKGVPVFDWGEDDFNFNVPVTIKGVDVLEKLAELEKLVKG